MDFFQEREFIEALGVSTEKRIFKGALKGAQASDIRLQGF
jgi:hypothetical protein